MKYKYPCQLVGDKVMDYDGVVAVYPETGKDKDGKYTYLMCLKKGTNLRTALGIKPFSAEAKKMGCTCNGESEINIDCPIHFPLYYLDLAHNIERQIAKMIKFEKYAIPIGIGFLILDIITRLVK